MSHKKPPKTKKTKTHKTQYWREMESEDRKTKKSEVVSLARNTAFLPLCLAEGRNELVD